MEQTIGQPVGRTGILRTLNIKKMIKRLLLTSTLLASSALAIQAQDLFLSEGQYYTDESQTTPYTGRYTEFYDDGMLKMELFLKDGRPEGTYVIYYPDGKIAEVRSYYHGIFHGEWRTYNEAGQLTGIASYKDGQKTDLGGCGTIKAFFVSKCFMLKEGKAAFGVLGMMMANC